MCIFVDDCWSDTYVTRQTCPHNLMHFHTCAGQYGTLYSSIGSLYLSEMFFVTCLNAIYEPIMVLYFFFVAHVFYLNSTTSIFSYFLDLTCWFCVLPSTGSRLVAYCIDCAWLMNSVAGQIWQSSRRGEYSILLACILYMVVLYTYIHIKMDSRKDLLLIIKLNKNIWQE